MVFNRCAPPLLIRPRWGASLGI